MTFIVWITFLWTKIHHPSFNAQSSILKKIIYAYILLNHEISENCLAYELSDVLTYEISEANKISTK